MVKQHWQPCFATTTACLEPLTFTGSRTSLAQLARWAKELGFEPKGLMMDEDGLYRYLERGLPPPPPFGDPSGIFVWPSDSWRIM